MLIILQRTGVFGEFAGGGGGASSVALDHLAENTGSLVDHLGKRLDHVDHLAEIPRFRAILWLENQDNDGSCWKGRCRRRVLRQAQHCLSASSWYLVEVVEGVEGLANFSGDFDVFGQTEIDALGEDGVRDVQKHDRLFHHFRPLEETPGFSTGGRGAGCPLLHLLQRRETRAQVSYVTHHEKKLSPHFFTENHPSLASHRYDSENSVVI